MKASKRFLIIIYLFFLFVGITTGCLGEHKSDVVKSQDSFKNTFPAVVKIQGKAFNIPTSSYFVDFISRTAPTYNRDLINNSVNVSHYNTKFKQAVNIGVYSIDLSYVSYYDQFSDGGDLFSAIKILALNQDVGSVSDAFLLSRIEQNRENRDSLTVIFSQVFTTLDDYLLRNSREDVSALIVAGAWVESLYLLVEMDNASDTLGLKSVIADQKYPLENIIRLLKPFYPDSSSDQVAFIDSLLDLALLYDGVVYDYKFIPPSTDENSQLTVINCKNSVVINEYQINQIKSQIRNIRQHITKID